MKQRQEREVRIYLALTFAGVCVLILGVLTILFLFR